MQRKAAKGSADILLAVPPDQLGDLRAESGQDGGVAVGVVGQEVDGGELDGLEKRAGLGAGGALPWRPLSHRSGRSSIRR